MHLLYCDESNLDAHENDFFIYGGISIDCTNSLEFSNELQKIRDEAKVSKEHLLKYAPRPEGIEVDNFNLLKQKYIETAIKFNSKFFVSIIHRSIMNDVEHARLNEINRIAYHFNNYLHKIKNNGILLIDRFTGKEIDGLTREKMQVGLTGMPYTNTMKLDRIIGYHYSAIGQSHFTSLVDIVLCTFRFILNTITREGDEKQRISKQLVDIIGPLFIINESKTISENSLFFSPKIIKVNKYRDQYQKVSDFFEACGYKPEQIITNMKSY